MTFDNNALRAMVREALRDALTTTGKLPMPTSQAAVTESVSLQSNSDLFTFVQRILDLAADPATAHRLRDGQIRFELAKVSTDSTSGSSHTRSEDGFRVDRGAVTELMVKKAAEAGGILVAGPAAVITPLARERARKLGVTITKESSPNRRDR